MPKKKIQVEEEEDPDFNSKSKTRTVSRQNKRHMYIFDEITPRMPNNILFSQVVPKKGHNLFLRTILTFRPVAGK